MVSDTHRPLEADSVEVHADFVEIAEVRAPLGVEFVNAAIALTQPRLKAFVVNGQLRHTVTGVDHLEGFAEEPSPSRRTGIITKPAVSVTALRDVSPELAHCEICAVLVVADEDGVAKGANFFSGFQDGCFAGFVVFAPPILTPVVKEEVGDAPVGSKQKGAEIVLQFAVVVVTVKGRVVDAAEPIAPLCLFVPLIPVEEHSANNGAVKTLCCNCAAKSPNHCNRHHLRPMHSFLTAFQAEVAPAYRLSSLPHAASIALTGSNISSTSPSCFSNSHGGS